MGTRKLRKPANEAKLSTGGHLPVITEPQNFAPLLAIVIPVYKRQDRLHIQYRWFCIKPPKRQKLKRNVLTLARADKRRRPIIRTNKNRKIIPCQRRIRLLAFMNITHHLLGLCLI